MKKIRLHSWSVRSLCLCLSLGIAMLGHCVFSAEADEAPSNDQLLAVQRESNLVRSLATGDYAVANDAQGDWYVCRITVGGEDASPKPYIDGATGAIIQPPGSVPIGQRLAAGRITVIEPLPGSPEAAGWAYRWVVAPTVTHGNGDADLRALVSGAECALVQMRKSAPPIITVPQDIVHVRPFPKAWEKDIAAGITYGRVNRQKFDDEVAFKELIGNENHLVKVAAMQAASKAHRFSADSWDMVFTQGADQHIAALATLFLLIECPTSQYEDLRARIHRRMNPESAPGLFLGVVSVVSFPNATASRVGSRKAFNALLTAIGDEAEKAAPTSPLIQALVATARDWVAGQKVEESEEKK